MRLLRHFAYLAAVAALAGMPTEAAALNPGDIVVSDVLDGQLRLLRLDPATGERTIISACLDATCSTFIGSGPKFPQGSSSLKTAIEPTGSILAAPKGFSFGVIYRVDSSTGDRTIVASTDQTTTACGSAGTPFDCCTGSGISDGTPPCADVGSGPALGANAFMAVAPTFAPALSSLPTWGLALLAGIVLGLAIKTARRPREA